MSVDHVLTHVFGGRLDSGSSSHNPASRSYVPPSDRASVYEHQVVTVACRISYIPACCIS
jgi:hypothetical protein